MWGDNHRLQISQIFLFHVGTMAFSEVDLQGEMARLLLNSLYVLYIHDTIWFPNAAPCTSPAAAAVAEEIELVDWCSTSLCARLLSLSLLVAKQPLVHHPFPHDADHDRDEQEVAADAILWRCTVIFVRASVQDESS